MHPLTKLGLLVFVACSGPTLADDQDNWMPAKLPKWTAPTKEDFYAPAAKRAGVEGTVLLAFDIGPDGQPKNVSVLWADNSVLGAGALQFLKGARFKIPTDWGATNLLRRWRLGFVYRLCPSAVTGEFAVPVEIVYISSPRLLGAGAGPVPALDEADTCQQVR